MKHAFRMTCATFSIAALVILFLVSTPISASAATHAPSAAHIAASVNTTCINDHKCAGQDPYADGCAGGSAHWGVIQSGYVRDSSNTIVGYIQLWYSNTCDTNWARTYNYSTSNEYTEVGIGYYNGSTLEDWACTDRLPDCHDIRTFQYWIPGAAAFWGNINGYRLGLHQ